jgi:putative addiction module component (TIGR02574 family)
MNATTKQIFEQARQLSDKERDELIGALIRTFDDADGSPEYTSEELDEEIGLRIAEIRSGEVKCIPWEEVRDRMDRS